MSDVDDPAPDQQPPPARLIAATNGAEEPRAVGPRGQGAGDAMTTAARLYALVALACAQRLATVEEAQQQQAQRLATVEEQVRTAKDGQQVLSAALAGVRARLACLEQAQQEPRATQERRRDGPNRRSLDAVWSAEERRRAERRIQQDRERFEDAVMAQYVPPRPAAVPRATDHEEEHTDATPAPPSPGPATVDDN